MSEIINLEIKADQSGADEALKQVNKSLKEGTEAAEALNHVLDGDLAGTFKSLGELSKTLSIDLGLAFSPAEIIAFVQVIAEVADKLSKLIADTVIYTDAMKEEDKAQRSLNQRWVDSAARIKAIGREMQITAEKTQAGQDALRLKFNLEDIGGTPEEIQAKIKKIQEAIKQATEDAKETETQEAPGSEAIVTGFTDKAIKADASLKGLNVTLSDLQRELRLANALAAQGAQVLANDLAAAADKAAQAKKREQDAINAAADRAAKDKKKEQNALDAWVAHAVRSRGTLTEAVKRMAKEQTQADIDANLALAKSEEARIAKINADEKKAAELKARIDQTILEAAKQHEAALGQLSDQRLNFELQIGKISQAVYEKQLQAQLAETYANERAKLEARRAAAAGNLEEQAKIDAQLQQLDDKYLAASEKAEQQSYIRRRQKFDQYFQQISGQFNTAINSWIHGTETASQAFAKMFDSIIGDLAGFVEKWIEHKAEMWLMDKILGESAQTTQIATHNAANAIMAQSDTFLAAANALATVPFPENIAASTEMLTMGTGFAISAASLAVGTNYVPMDGLAYLHKGEKVIPAGTTGPGYSGGGITVVINHSVNAVDAASFQGHIRRHSNMIANEVTRALKRKGVR